MSLIFASTTTCGALRSALAVSVLFSAIACGGTQTTETHHGIGCDEVELLARTDRPDIIRRELEYLHDAYASAPGTPTDHVTVRVAEGTDPAALGHALGETVRSVRGGVHLFVFPSIDAATTGVQRLLCDQRVVEATMSLHHER